MNRSEDRRLVTAQNRNVQSDFRWVVDVRCSGVFEAFDASLCSPLAISRLVKYVALL